MASIALPLPSIPRVKLGTEGLEVSQLGLGCMGMSMAYGAPKPEEEMIKLIRHAVDIGVTFLDTADMYGPHTNELLVGKVRQFASPTSTSSGCCPENPWALSFCSLNAMEIKHTKQGRSTYFPLTRASSSSSSSFRQCNLM